MWGVIVAGILLLDNRFDLDAIGWEVAVVAILFWVVGVIYMLIYAKKILKAAKKKFSMISPGPLASYVGFTETEVEALCR